MSMNLVTVLYLIASICFIQALKGLSHPTTSRRGNLFGMLGMGLAAFTTIALIAMKVSEFQQRGVGIDLAQGLGFVLVGLLVGGSAGAIMAKRVEMTKMPELVAFMHSMIGLAAVFIAIAAVVEPQSLGIVASLGDAIPVGNRLELFLGAAIGAITFSGSVIAFGKLSGKYKFRLFQGAPVQFKGQHMLNLAIGLTVIGLGLVYMFTGNLQAFAVMLALAHQVRATSTAARVQALVGLGALSPGEGEDLAEALHVFMALKLKAGLAEQEQARPVSGTVVVQQLSSLDRDLLKDALGVVKRFQHLLRTRFHLGAL